MDAHIHASQFSQQQILSLSSWWSDFTSRFVIMYARIVMDTVILTMEGGIARSLGVSKEYCLIIYVFTHVSLLSVCSHCVGSLVSESVVIP